jgi:hypothetical protein
VYFYRLFTIVAGQEAGAVRASPSHTTSSLSALQTEAVHANGFGVADVLAIASVNLEATKASRSAFMGGPPVDVGTTVQEWTSYTTLSHLEVFKLIQKRLLRAKIVFV